MYKGLSASLLRTSFQNMILFSLFEYTKASINNLETNHGHWGKNQIMTHWVLSWLHRGDRCIRPRVCLSFFFFSFLFFSFLGGLIFENFPTETNVCVVCHVTCAQVKSYCVLLVSYISFTYDATLSRISIGPVGFGWSERMSKFKHVQLAQQWYLHLQKELTLQSILMVNEAEDADAWVRQPQPHRIDS